MVFLLWRSVPAVGGHRAGCQVHMDRNLHHAEDRNGHTRDGVAYNGRNHAAVFGVAHHARQLQEHVVHEERIEQAVFDVEEHVRVDVAGHQAVSYTHLTLPTN